MAKAVAIFWGGVTERREMAVRTDGAVFQRVQARDPRYGYRWGRWRPTGETLGENARHGLDTMHLGFATLHRARPDGPGAYFKANGEIRVRLP